MVVHLRGRARMRYPQHLELRAVAHAGELLERELGLNRQAIQLPDHEIDDIVREVLGVNATKIPGPTPLAGVEREQALVRQRRDELNREEWIARRFLVDQFRQRGGAFRFAVK